ncbi:response regulator transcription factor [Paraburkholderia sacchari]|uniref:response regulator transcription factor n=1 Tax=Paraburkholderia sacchari TaxID=159450 RepID=UPI001BCD3093|nr:LuxR C-terminal-related transcriptional regulator [Paraburkholderia sacchari]
MSESAPVVLVADDDAHVRRAFERLLRSAGYQVETFGSAGELMTRSAAVDAPVCVLLDLRLLDLYGLDVQRRLDASVPVVIVSACADLNVAVGAMKAGAFDFLAKPVDVQVLFDATASAVAHAKTLYEQRKQYGELRQRARLLTPREQEVMALVVIGLMNKQIADRLGASEKTIKIHRARVMEKMQANSVPELVRLVRRLDSGPPPVNRSLSLGDCFV